MVDELAENLKNRGIAAEGDVYKRQMHGSKGLEYDAVFLPCCMEGVVPHKKSKNQAALEEELSLIHISCRLFSHFKNILSL